MPTDRLARQILYSHLPQGQRPRGRPRLRYNDTIKRNLNKLILIPIVEICGTTARCMERHSKLVLEMKAVFLACYSQATAMRDEIS